jgi:hypothetical protein
MLLFLVPEITLPGIAFLGSERLGLDSKCSSLAADPGLSRFVKIRQPKMGQEITCPLTRLCSNTLFHLNRYSL